MTTNIEQTKVKVSTALHDVVHIIDDILTNTEPKLNDSNMQYRLTTVREMLIAAGCVLWEK